MFRWTFINMVLINARAAVVAVILNRRMTNQSAQRCDFVKAIHFHKKGVQATHFDENGVPHETLTWGVLVAIEKGAFENAATGSSSG